MSACSKFLGATALSLVFTVPANAQAPQTERNVSMKMALDDYGRGARAMLEGWL